eukprot:6490859-Amphidinium_carterae.2
MLLHMSDVKSRTKARRGGGGLWRAWIRFHSLGKTGTVDLKQLAQKYRLARASKDALLQRLREVAKAAVIVARTNKTSKSSFGLDSKREQRLSTKLKRRALWRRSLDKQPAERLDVIVAPFRHELALKEAMSTAKTLQYMDSVREKQTKETNLAILRNFMLNDGLRNAKMLKDAIPTLPFSVHCLVPIPTCKGIAFSLPPVASQVVASAVAFASHSHATNLGHALETEWLQQHEPIAAENCPALAVKGTQVSKCRQSGMCVCRGAGKQHFNMRNRLLKALKIVSHGKEQRQQLAQGFLVVRVIRADPCVEHAAADTDYWMHLGHMSFSPYRPTIHWLLLAEDTSIFVQHHDDRVVLEAAGGKNIQATQKYNALTVACQSLCLQCKWRLSWYEIENSLCVLTQLKPTLVAVRPMHSTSIDENNVWPPPKRGRRPKAKAKSSTSKKGGTTTSSLAPIVEPEPEDIDDVETEEEVMDVDDAGNIESVLEELLDKAEALQPMFLEHEGKASDSEAPMHEEDKGSHPGETLPAPDRSGEAPLEQVQALAAPGTALASTDQAPAPVAPNDPAPASVVTAPPPPPPPAAYERTPRGLVGVADAVAYVEGGKISFYANKNVFQATCMDRGHGVTGKCTMTRTSRGRISKGVETSIAGRPLGFLSLWLSRHAQATTKEEHTCKEALKGYSHADRLQARHALLETNAGKELATCERLEADGEGLEPLTMKGMV